MLRPNPEPPNLFTLRKPDPKKMAKRDSPISSKRSAEIAADHARGQYVEIRKALVQAAPGGLDLHEIAEATGIQNNTVSARLAEMQKLDMAWLRYDQNFNPIIKKTKNGGVARVWFANPEGEIL